MKKKYVTALLATLIITATATAVPFAIYASTDDEINTIAVENEVAETETAGRSIYVGAKAPLNIREKFLDKLGYKDDKDINMKDVSLELKEELVADTDNEDLWIPTKETPDDVMTVKDDTVTFNREGIFRVEITVGDKTTSVLVDVDEELFASVDINDWAVINGTKDPNFLSSLVTFDEEKVKDITIKGSEVNLNKDGDYLLTYEITDVEGKTYEKSVIVTVADKDAVADLEDEGVWVAKQNITVSAPSDNTDKDSNPAPVISGNSTADSSRPATKPSHSDSNQADQHEHSYVTIVTKEATCTEKGTKVVKCETCGEVFKTEAIAPKGHHWNNKVVTKEPTCTEEGTAEYTCDACGEKKTESIEVLGHDVIETIITEPTCGTAGSKELTCSRCDYKEIAEIPATGEHTWDEGVITTEPTCGVEGEKTYTCTVCGEQKTEAIAKLEHAYGEWEVVKAPTCTVYGSEARICANCGRAEMRIVDALGHDLQEEVITPATCGEAGEKKVTCSRCDYEEIVEIPATGEHTYGEWEVVTPATCGDAGLEKTTCTVCGHEETREIPATGEHAWDAGVVTTEPTCTEKGVKTYTCTVCGETKTEEIEMIAHSYGNWVTTKEPTCAVGEEQRTCSVCGHVETREIPATGTHTFGEWVIDKDASCGVAGSQHRTCSVCGETETQEIPALEHNYTSVITREPTCTNPGERTYTCTLCGNTKTEAIPVVDHKWVHHDAVTHEEIITPAWDEKVAIWKIQCNGCGEWFDSADEAISHIMMDFGDDCQNYSSKIYGYDIIHHDAVTETVVDVPAYDECSVCGTTK